MLTAILIDASLAVAFPGFVPAARKRTPYIAERVFCRFIRCTSSCNSFCAYEKKTGIIR